MQRCASSLAKWSGAGSLTIAVAKRLCGKSVALVGRAVESYRDPRILSILLLRECAPSSFADLAGCMVKVFATRE
jgi:hypothetical protein